MNFFRLRVINTLLFFLIGTLVGFILKERFYPARPAGYPERYQPGYASRVQSAEQPAPQIETMVEPEETEEPEPAAAPEPVPPPEKKRDPAAVEDDSAATVIEASPREPAPAPEKSAGRVLQAAGGLCGAGTGGGTADDNRETLPPGVAA